MSENYPPTARRLRTELQLHGTLLTDDYAWLREKENPEVIAYLEAENAYAEAEMAPLKDLREELYSEMLSHIKQTDVSVPFRDGNWWYLTRTEEGKQYPIFCRRDANLAGPSGEGSENVILDGNILAQGHAFFSVGATEITDDGRWLAYTTDTTGFRQYTLHVKDLLSGETLAGAVERVGSLSWAADNQTLFYTVEDEEQKRQYQPAMESFSFSSRRATPRPNATCWPLQSLNMRSRCSLPAKMSTNIQSITATGGGSSAPTIAGATSGWLPRRWMHRRARTGTS
jgi:oligopeptidase B